MPHEPQTEAVTLRPVFIGGCDRSGTTMLGSMLGASDGAVCTPESHFPAELAKLVSNRGTSRGQLLGYLEGHIRFRWWGVGERPPQKWGESREPASLDDVRELITWSVLAYARKHRQDLPAVSGEVVWIDHSPFNVRHAKYLADLYPNARFIHIVRDGRAVSASILPLDWGPNTMRFAARWWVMALAHAFAAESYLGEERIRRVRYEDLVLEPARALGPLAAFTSLTYGQEAVEGGKFRVPGYEKFHALVGAPPDASRINAWKSQLKPRQIEVFEAFAGEMLELLGYPLEYGGNPRPERVYERAMGVLREEAMRLLNDRRHARRLRVSGPKAS